MNEDTDGKRYRPDAYYERRQHDRRSGEDRRGVLRWDPRAAEKERRSGDDRRREADYTRQ